MSFGTLITDVVSLCSHTDSTQYGAEVPRCIQLWQYTEAQIRQALDRLQAEGHIYSTVDADHWAVAVAVPDIGRGGATVIPVDQSQASNPGEDNGCKEQVLTFIRNETSKFVGWWNMSFGAHYN